MEKVEEIILFVKVLYIDLFSLYIFPTFWQKNLYWIGHFLPLPCFYFNPFRIIIFFN